jgi:hypothetical protein
MTDQEKIDELARIITGLIVKRKINSSVAVLAMLSTIENICDHEKAKASFKRMTINLLNDQAFRINDTMRIKST